MRLLRNQDGIALITALMFTLLSLGMIMLLLYYVLAGTRMSASHKRYRNSMEAAYGGTDLVTKTILPRLLVFNSYSGQKNSLLSEFSGELGLSFPSASPALKTKLSTATASWPSNVSATPNPKDAPDITLLLKGATATGKFKVYTKIVDTVPGVGLLDATNIDYLDGGLGVAGSSSSTATLRTPNIYSIEVLGESAANPQEKAALSVLYAY